MRRLAVFLLIVLSVLNIGFAQEQKMREDIRVIIDLLNAKDHQRLLDVMADSCRIGNLPKIDHTKLLPEILSKFNAIADYQITADTILADGNNLVFLAVTYADGKAGKPTLLFNQADKLINLGIIKARMRGEPEVALAQAIASAVKPDSMHIHFQMNNGLIYIPARLNGQDGYFMFDSGAPVLILRKKYVADQYINKDVTVDFTGMGGVMQGVQWSAGNELQWGDMLLSGLDAPVADMNDMETENGAPIFGLMGYGVLQGYQLTFDYANQELLFERVDERGELTGVGFAKGEVIDRSVMRMKRHIPIIDVQFGTKTYPMGLDCGANANVMKTEIAKDLSSYIDYEEEEVSIAGVGGLAQNNKVAFLMQGRVGNVSLQDMYTVVTDQAIGAGSGSEALPIVGLLGTPFLNQFKMTLNFNRGEIVFYK